jgi:F-type H+-transporting ATPase subunit b
MHPRPQPVAANPFRIAGWATAALAVGLVAPLTALAQAPPALAPEPAAPVAPPPPAPMGGGGGGGGGGTFLVTPSLGLMIWTLLAFAITLLILRKFAFPRIAEALDKRRRAIDESLDASQRARDEAEKLLREYRSRLKEARGQADEIVVRARRNAESTEEQAKKDGQREREEMIERAKRDIQAETERSLDEIRRQVADLTVLATEKVTRKSLTEDDQHRLVEEALSEVDFTRLVGGSSGGSSDGRNGQSANGG